jgi:glutamate-5-semialdehyde dehydrogenase
MEQLLRNARSALTEAPPPGDPAYQRFASALGECLDDAWPALREANRHDLAAAGERGLAPAIVERLRLDDPQRRHLVALTATVRDALPAVTASRPSRPAGGWGTLRAVARPLGVILMVYEARPTVTVEGALLGAAVGNAVLLRGGREMARTDAAVGEVIRRALLAAGLPRALVSVLDDPDRSVVRALLGRPDAIDVLIPRGSPSLIDYCRRNSAIPVIASGGGVNHLYVHHSGDLELAARVTLDSKVPEPTACNTLELVLVDSAVAASFQRALIEQANRGATALQVRSGLATGAPSDGAVAVAPLGPHDFGREFLDVTVGVHAVDGVAGALAHIARYGSGHTEGIIASDPEVIDRFCGCVDAAAVVVNGSLRLHDGPTLGLGPELSISTGRLHVRGPVTLGDLVTYGWRVDAAGTLRAEVDGERRPSDPRTHSPHREPTHAH